jgi:hypothetical protein
LNLKLGYLDRPILHHHLLINRSLLASFSSLTVANLIVIKEPIQIFVEEEYLTQSFSSKCLKDEPPLLIL